MLKAGDMVGGRFRLIRPIGAGGMGRVFWARHELIGRDVALKVSPALQDEHAQRRFLREATIIGKFDHRNIVDVLDAGVLEDEGCVFLVMELLRGMPFSERLIPKRPLAAEEVIPILIEICAGLEVAHMAGVVHRDVKPENIFLAVVPGEGIIPKLLDFGISRVMLEEAGDALTIEGQILGTPSYMSPEQVFGRGHIDARTDVWAIGVLLYESLSGRKPFKAVSPFGTLRQITDVDPPPLPDTVDPRLRAIAERCMQKDPARRYQDAASLRAALVQTLSPASASAPRVPLRARRIAGAAMIAVEIAVGVALWGWVTPIAPSIAAPVTVPVVVPVSAFVSAFVSASVPASAPVLAPAPAPASASRRPSFPGRRTRVTSPGF